MNRILIAIAVLSLAGCATALSDVQERPPALTVTTVKSVADYIACVQPLWMDIWPGSNVMVDGDTRTLVATEPRVFLATVTVRPVDDGSFAEYRQMNDVTRGTFRRARESVEACR